MIILDIRPLCMQDAPLNSLRSHLSAHLITSHQINNYIYICRST